MGTGTGCGVSHRARSLRLSFTCLVATVLAVGTAVSVIVYYHVRAEACAYAVGGLGSGMDRRWCGRWIRDPLVRVLAPHRNTMPL